MSEQLNLFSSREKNYPLPPAKSKVIESKKLDSKKDLELESNAPSMNEIEKPLLSSERLSYYRSKLAKWDDEGYQEVAEEIAVDTIHEHNSLGRDMQIVGKLDPERLTIDSYDKYRRSRLTKNPEIKAKNKLSKNLRRK